MVVSGNVQVMTQILWNFYILTVYLFQKQISRLKFFVSGNRNVVEITTTMSV